MWAGLYLVCELAATVWLGEDECVDLGCFFM